MKRRVLLSSTIQLFDLSNLFGVGSSLIRRVGIFALLLSVLLLPLLHLHPAYNHAHGETEGHQHQPAVHADFFPDAAHEHEHHDDHEQGVGDLGVSVESSHHAFFQIDLLSLHIGQSSQFSSVFKKQLIVLAHDSPELFVFPDFQRRAFYHQNAPPQQAPRFSPPSLRAPPYFA